MTKRCPQVRPESTALNQAVALVTVLISTYRGAGKRMGHRPNLLQVLPLCPKEGFTKERSLQTFNFPSFGTTLPLF